MGIRDIAKRHSDESISYEPETKNELVEIFDNQYVPEYELSIVNDIFDSFGQEIIRGLNVDAKDGHVTYLSLKDHRGESTVPESINDLTKLETLIVYGVRTEYPNPNFSTFRKLRHLEISNISMDAFPHSIEDLDLRYLYLAGNGFDSVPDCISDLKNLMHLTLERNPISYSPASVTSLKNLKYLNLDGCELREIPEDIGNLENLRHFSAMCNYIPKIPDSIGRLKKLEDLSLTSNEITEIPNSLCSIESLDTVYLSDNKIDTIPTDFYKMARSEILVSIAKNQINDYWKERVQKMWENKPGEPKKGRLVV